MPPRSRHPLEQTYPPTQTPTPLGADTLPEQTPPMSRHPPRADTPQEQTPPEQTPPQEQTPPGRDGHCC